MKTSVLMVSDDMHIIFSLEQCDAIEDHYNFAIHTTDGKKQVNNRLQVTIPTSKAVELFETIDKLKCCM